MAQDSENVNDNAEACDIEGCCDVPRVTFQEAVRIAQELTAATASFDPTTDPEHLAEVERMRNPVSVEWLRQTSEQASA